jgi:valyl-tRNA synthetase
LFDDKLCEQGRNFSNKIWNAFRLIKGWKIDSSLSGKENEAAVKWFESRFNESLVELNEHFSKYRISDALMTAYKLTWDDFCSWYLEMIKPGFEQPLDQKTYEATIAIFEKLLKLLHPFMPFITEELWHEIKERNKKDCLIVASWPKVENKDEALLDEATLALEVITNIRNVRNSKQLGKSDLELVIKTVNMNSYKQFIPVIKKLAILREVSFTTEKPEGSAGFLIGTDEFFIPLKGEIDPDKERDRILKDLEHAKGFLQSVEKKLNNERFVNSAPANVVDMEKKKKADAEAKIKALEESLTQFSA